MSEGKRVQTQKQQLIAALKQGRTLSEIGRSVFHSTGTGSVNAFIEKYGIPVHEYSERYRFMDRNWLTRQIAAGKTPSENAKEFHMPRTSITRYAHRYGLYESKFHRNPSNAINSAYFDKIDTADKAYWLGFCMADGSLYDYTDGSKKSQFELKLQESDADHIVLFAEAVGFPIDKIQHKTSVRAGNTNKSVLLRTYDKAFCQSLQKYGICSHKSGKECFPKSLIPVGLQRDFVRGFWDGDGNVGSQPHAVSLSFDMVSDLNEYFTTIYIYSNVRRTLTASGKYLYSVYIPEKSFRAFDEKIYYKGCFGLPRKIEASHSLQSTLLE